METQEKRLARLQGATSRLVQIAEDLRGERDRLQGQLSTTEQESEELRREVATLRGERETIRERLEAMDAALSKALTTPPDTHASPDTTGAKEPARRQAKGSPASAVGELSLF
ncbi:MAG: hypothetical protein PVF51_06270 [Nitrospirota bacterium]|jgi:chromosome segregation ATPase